MLFCVISKEDNSTLLHFFRTPTGSIIIDMGSNGSKSRSSFGDILAFLIYFHISLFLIAGIAYYSVTMLSKDLPSFEELETIPENQELSTIVYSADGVELRTFQREKRFAVSYDEIPQVMIDALLSAEDIRFFDHWGVSVRDALRALVVNLKSTRFTISKRFPFFLDLQIEEGASTITQQLARDLFLTRETSYTRKLREMLVALQLEHTYSKEEILEFFLNQMFFGNNSYGIQAAARGYFGKNTSELNLPESALLAGILQSPSRFNPRSTRRPPEEQLQVAQSRRDIVLGMMANKGKIPVWKYQEEIAKPIELSDPDEFDYGKAPYFVQYVRQLLQDKYGDNFLETSGAKIVTTLDYSLQQIAERVLTQQLDTIQAQANRIHYQRPPGLTDTEAIQDSLSKKAVQGALVAIDIRTGKILAMIGGRDFTKYNQFNRATQATRQAGSSFKPFVYTAALDNGWRPCDTIYDGYVSYPMPDGTFWEPRNFNETYLGVLSLRDGMKRSQNIISVKLVNDIQNRGIGPETVVMYAKRMGISTYIPPVMAISVGVPEVKLIEMVSAYTIFPNFGIHKDDFAIQSIFDKNNNLIERQNEGTAAEVLSPEVASLMVTMMRSVVTDVGGTAHIMLPQNGFGDRPAAGKTGTAQDSKDTWFIGYTPYIACGVWIGFDAEETIVPAPYNTGSTGPLPVWRDFVKEASELKGYPKDEFQLSKGITTQKLCRDSYLRAGPNCPEESIYTEYFIEGTELGPNEFCDKHGNMNRPDSRSLINDSRTRPRRGP